MISPPALCIHWCHPCGSPGSQAAAGFAIPFPAETSCLHLDVTAALQSYHLPGSFLNGIYFPCFCGAEFGNEQPAMDWRVTSPEGSQCTGARLFTTAPSPTSSISTHPQLTPADAARPLCHLQLAPVITISSITYIPLSVQKVQICNQCTKNFFPAAKYVKLTRKAKQIKRHIYEILPRRTRVTSQQHSNTTPSMRNT